MHDDLLAPERIGEIVRRWWLAVSLGAASVAAGAIVLARPGNSLSALSVVIGIYILFDGVVELYIALSRQVENRAVTVLIAVLNVIIGIVLVRHPFSGVQAIDLSIGIWLISVGTIRLVLAFDTAKADRLGLLILAGVEMLAGIAVVASADIDYATLSLLVGFAFVANGIGMIVFGLLLRAARSGAGPPPAVAA